MSAGKRTDKVASMLQKELADIFLIEGKDLWGNTFITISGVTVTPDIGEAWVYLSFFKEENKKEMLQKIESHNKEIRHFLAKRIKNQVRIIPILKFYIDETLDYVEKMDNLFKNLDIPPADAK